VQYLVTKEELEKGAETTIKELKEKAEATLKTGLQPIADCVSELHNTGFLVQADKIREALYATIANLKDVYEIR
jgi:hypothetical protein